MRHYCLLFLSILSFHFLQAGEYTFHPHGAYLGVKSYQLEPEKARLLGFENQFGNYLTHVYQDTPAAEVGLQPFDYIYKVGEYTCDDGRDLSDILEEFEAGDKTTIYFVRNGKAMSVQVTLGSKRSGASSSKTDEEDPHFGIWKNENDRREEMGVDISVSRYGLAQEMGLRSHDRILSFNTYPIVDYRDLTTAINITPVGQEFTVVYQRKGEQYTAKAKMRSKAEHDRQVVAKKAKGRPFIGINLEVVNSSKAKELGFEHTNGSYITSIVPNTAAEKSGLQPFDYIYGVDEEYVDNHRSLSDILSYYEPDDEAKLHIVRKGKPMIVPITIGRRSDAGERPDLGCDGPFFGVTYNDSGSDQPGVGVNVVAGSSAEKLGLKGRDIIMKINGYQIADFTDVTTAIEMLRAGETIEVEYKRDGKIMKGNTAIGSECDRKEQSSWNWNTNDDKWMQREREPGEPAHTVIDEAFEQVDLENVRVGMENLTQGEADALKNEYGIALSLENNLTVNNLNLFPDPSEGVFRLQFELPKRSDTIIRIYNNMGRLIYNYELGDFSGSFDDTINIVQNGAGAYYLEIVQNDNSFVKKVLLANM